MRTELKGLGTAVAVVALMGCGGDREGSEVATKLATSMCSLAFDCCNDAELNLVLGHFVTENECVDRVVNSATLAPSALLSLDVLGAQASLPNLRALDQAISRGRISVDAEALEACLEYLDSLPCNSAGDEEEDERCSAPEELVEPLCDAREIFIGQIGDGGTCTSSASGLECEPGLTCRIDPSVGLEGVCVARGEVNDLCFADSECQEDLYCSRLNGLCQVPRAEGETCLYANPNDPTPPESTLVIACEEGLRCDPITDTCVAPCQRGAACAADDDCDEEAGFACVMGRCDLLREADLPCQVDDDCAESLRCIEDPAFPASRVCAEPLELGEACDPFSENDVCASGYCDSSTATCAEPVEPGELCPTRDDDQCAGGYCETTIVLCSDDEDCLGSGSCDTAIGQCEPYCVEQRPDGASCEVGIECQSGTCIAETCRTLPLDDGTPCTSDFQCDSLFCSLDEDRVCDRLPLSNGETCGFDEQCSSGICFQGSCNAGLTEGQSCADASQPPCAQDLYCNPDEREPTCRPLHGVGEPCDEDYQCRGSCSLRLGRFFCDETPPPGSLMCEGA